MRRVGALLALLLLAPPGLGLAAISKTFDANGKVYATGSSTLSELLNKPLNTKAGVWSAAQGSGNVARMTLTRNVALGSAEGATVPGAISATLATELTAAELAAGAIRIARGGIAGVLVGAALEFALSQAKLSFDSLQQSMVYNPPVVDASTTPGTVTYYILRDGTKVYDQQRACDDRGRGEWGPNFVSSTSFGPHACMITYKALDSSGSVRVQEPIQRSVTWGEEPGEVYNEKHCPNGVQFNDTTKCRELVDDGRAGDLLTPKINTNNGPDIGKNTQGGTGNQNVPETGVEPSGNPLPYDHSSWPKVSGPGQQSFGPQSTTSEDTTTSIDAQGQPHSFTTTTTVTNTTNVTNQYTNNQVTTNITNNQTTVTCDAAGVCTNKTTKTTPEGDPGTGDDSDIKTCGLPSTPPCKIDETGTPGKAESDGAFGPPTTGVAKTQADAIDAINKAVVPDGKNTAWTFTFAFPSNCSPLTVWPGMVVNVCPYQPVFHDIMTMVWWGTAFFAVFSMWNRAILSGGA